MTTVMMRFLPVASILFILMAGGHVYQAWRIAGYQEDNATLQAEKQIWKETSIKQAKEYEKRDQALVRREKRLVTLSQETDRRLQQLNEVPDENACFKQHAGLAVISSLRDEPIPDGYKLPATTSND